MKKLSFLRKCAGSQAKMFSGSTQSIVGRKKSVSKRKTISYLDYDKIKM